MDFTRNNVEFKNLSYKAIFDKSSPMSGRVASAVIYTVIHASMNVPTVSPTARPMNLAE